MIFLFAVQVTEIKSINKVKWKIYMYRVNMLDLCSVCSGYAKNNDSENCKMDCLFENLKTVESESRNSKMWHRIDWNVWLAPLSSVAAWAQLFKASLA